MTKPVKTAKDYAREFASKGGRARAKAMTAEERSESSRKAVRKRWDNMTAKDRKALTRTLSRAAKKRWAKARKAASDGR